jgi:hypothetical protein
MKNKDMKLNFFENKKEKKVCHLMEMMDENRSICCLSSLVGPSNYKFIVFCTRRATGSKIKSLP